MMLATLHSPKIWADDISIVSAKPCQSRAQMLMTPSPRAVVLAMRDLGMSDDEIGRYFDLPADCIFNIAPLAHA